MTFIIFIVWAVISFFIGIMFFRNLGSVTVTHEHDENGETYETEEWYLTVASTVQILIIIAWTAFAFWLIGKQMYQYAFMY